MSGAAGSECHHTRLREQGAALMRCGHDRAGAHGEAHQDRSRGKGHPAQRGRLGGHSGALKALSGVGRLRAGAFPLSGLRDGAYRPHATGQDLADGVAAADGGDSMPRMRTASRPRRYLLRMRDRHCGPQKPLPRIPLPRSTAPSHHGTGRVQGERPNHHGNCRSRVEENAPALLARSHGSQEECTGRAGNETGSAGDSGDTSRGYDTRIDTKKRQTSEAMPHLVDSMVELSGIEPLTSSLRTRRSPS